MEPQKRVLFHYQTSRGPGYRIYYGQSGISIVILLLAGDKRSQKQDIHKAHQFWLDYITGELK